MSDQAELIFSSIDYDYFVQFCVIQTLMNDVGRSAIGKRAKITWVDHKEGQYAEPTFVMTREKVQAMFNRLWDMGYRPNDRTGSAGHIEAINKHLEDMRTLVFHGNTTHEGNKP